MSPMLNTPKYLNAGGCFKAECPTFPVAVGATEFGMSRREFSWAALRRVDQKHVATWR